MFDGKKKRYSFLWLIVLLLVTSVVCNSSAAIPTLSPTETDSASLPATMLPAPTILPSTPTEPIILDEPTMGLSLKEPRRLLDFVRDIKKAGKAAIFIDHNIFHVYSVADRVVVIDRGKVAGEFMTKDISLDDLMDKMYRVAETGVLS